MLLFLLNRPYLTVYFIIINHKLQPNDEYILKVRSTRCKLTLNQVHYEVFMS